ncbi:hypothetical protein RvY_18623 [Ramazzottius varieornatus]|uniref:BTB domain-containing protein n=1 Tax=Ramazzottius varieornatus TaxID=947166 RepID=A0A1D1W6G3_RAMVA|nr:hypothetical protein RvY_18623 [Ramazzottius varieornatus]
METETGRCELPDVSTETLDTLLHFMYYNCTKDLASTEHAEDVLVAADKYQMNDLKEACERILAVNLDEENGAELLVLADEVSAKYLKNAALRHIAVSLPVMENCSHLEKTGETAHMELVKEVLTAVGRWGVK